MERKKLSLKGCLVWWSMTLVSSLVTMGAIYVGAITLAPYIAHLFLLNQLNTPEKMLLSCAFGCSLFGCMWWLHDVVATKLNRWFDRQAEKGGFYASI